MKWLLQIIILLVCLSGCALRCTLHFIDFSIISTKELPLSNYDAPVVKGKSCGSVSFAHIELSSIEKAIQDALDKSGADYLTDVRIYRYFEHRFFSGYDCFIVEGKAIKEPR